MMERE